MGPMHAPDQTTPCPWPDHPAPDQTTQFNIVEQQLKETQLHYEQWTYKNHKLKINPDQQSIHFLFLIWPLSKKWSKIVDWKNVWSQWIIVLYFFKSLDLL